MRHAFNNMKLQGAADQQIFYGTSQSALSSTVQNWQVWRKPKNCTMVHILCLGGGGGGGSGFTSAAVSASPGGGGGGGASASSVLMPSMMLPDNLYVFVGAGGTAGIAGSGVVGRASYVAVMPILAETNVASIVAVGNGGGLGATPANSTTGGALGAAGSTPTIAVMPYATRGVASFFAGVVGIVGATTGNGGGTTLSATSTLVTGGNGGGGVAASGNGMNGGGVLGSTTFTMPGDLRVPHTSNNVYCAGGVGSAGAPTHGQDGLSFMYGMIQSVGGGGGASTPASGTWTAGNGGAGGYGSGGGGGGGCFTSGTRSIGGKGGDGLVIITWW